MGLLAGISTAEESADAEAAVVSALLIVVAHALRSSARRVVHASVLLSSKRGNNKENVRAKEIKRIGDTGKKRPREGGVGKDRKKEEIRS